MNPAFSLPLLPIVSVVGPTGSGKSGAAIAMCQTLATPLSFAEYNNMRRAATRDEAKDHRPSADAAPLPPFAVAHCDIGRGQILAANVDVEFVAATSAATSAAAAAAPTNTDKIVVSTCDETKFQLAVLRRADEAAEGKEANAFVCNRCIITLQPLMQDQPIVVDPATLVPEHFVELERHKQMELVSLLEPPVRALLARSAASHSYTVQSASEKLKVVPHPAMGETLTCKLPVKSGEVLYDLMSDQKVMLPFATMYTICVSNGVHMLVDGGSQCLAHSCDPNTRIVIVEKKQEKEEKESAGEQDVLFSLQCVAIKDIQPDEAVSFNYLTTEWDMDAPFDCACDGGAGNGDASSRRCFGRIAGFKHLSPQQQDALLPHASPIVRALHSSHHRKQRQKQQQDQNDNAEATNPSSESSHHLLFRSNAAFRRGAVIAIDVAEQQQQQQRRDDSCGAFSVVLRDESGYVFPIMPQDMFDADGVDGDFDDDRAVPLLPAACLVPSLDGRKNCVVALRSIRPGEVVTVRGTANTSRAADDPSRLNLVNAHIINVDVMQTFDGLPIGTNKPTRAEQGGISHEMLGSRDVSTSANADNDDDGANSDKNNTNNIHGFIKSVTDLIKRIRDLDSAVGRASLIVLCGGTLYYQLALLVQGVSLLEENNSGGDNNNNNKATTASLLNQTDDDNTGTHHDESDGSNNNSNNNNWALWTKLAVLNPDAASRFHPNDTRRIERQIEICLSKKDKKSSDVMIHEEEDEEEQQQQSDRHHWRNFSGSPSEPAPVVLWVHQGDDRAAFISKLHARVDKMVQLGLLEEVLTHALSSLLRRRSLVVSNGGGNSESTTSTTRTTTMTMMMRLLLDDDVPGNTKLITAVEELAKSVSGVESAIGFKELVVPVVKFAASVAAAKFNKAATAAGNKTTSATPTFQDLLQGATSDAAVREGIQRVKTATWRYAAQQDHWLRRRFLPLRAEGALPILNVVKNQQHNKSNVMTMLWNCIQATVDGVVRSTTTKALPTTEKNTTTNAASPSSSCSRFDALVVFSSSDSAVATVLGQQKENNEASSKKMLYRCDCCNKAMVGDDQWQAHIKTKAHKKNMTRVEPTAEQIEKWKCQGLEVHEKRRRQREEESVVTP